MKKVYYTTPHIPFEWIEAHGLQPVQVIPDESVADRFPDTEGLCGFMRSFYADMIGREDAAGFIASTSCDQMRRGADRVSEDLPAPVYLFHMPATWSGQTALRIYEQELQQLSQFLCEIGGRRPSDKQLREVLLKAEEKRGLVENYFAAEKYSSFAKRREILFAGGDGEYAVEHMKDETAQRILLLGGPVTSSILPVVELLERAGYEVTVDGSEFGFRVWPGKYERRELQDNPFEEMAEKWFFGNHSVYQRPNSGLFQWVEEQRANFDAVLYIRWLWCDFWHAEEKRFQEWLKVPFLSLDIHGIDSISRNRVRVEAFLETMQESVI